MLTQTASLFYFILLLNLLLIKLFEMTIFSKIIAGEIPSYKIAENEKFFAFLDIFPLVEGHVLVVPKIEVDNLFDVPDEYLSQILLFSRPIYSSSLASHSCTSGSKRGRTPKHKQFK